MASAAKAAQSGLLTASLELEHSIPVSWKMENGAVVKFS
jgi:hypothetical protein